MSTKQPTTNYQSLPSWTYTSEAFFELEKQHLFLTSWQLVCHLSNIPNSGDYFTFELFNERIIALRGDDNVVRAFHNVCAHRAARLLDGDSGNCGKRLTCPYHNWRYDLSGNLTNVPYRDQFVDFDETQHGHVAFHQNRQTDRDRARWSDYRSDHIANYDRGRSSAYRSYRSHRLTIALHDEHRHYEKHAPHYRRHVVR